MLRGAQGVRTYIQEYMRTDNLICRGNFAPSYKHICMDREKKETKYPSTSLLVSLSLFLFVSLSLPTCLLVCLSFCLSFHPFLSLSLSFSLSLSLTLFLFFSLSPLNPSFPLLLSPSPSTILFVSVTFCFSFSLPPCLFTRASLSVFLSPFPPFSPRSLSLSLSLSLAISHAISLTLYI